MKNLVMTLSTFLIVLCVLPLYGQNDFGDLSKVKRSNAPVNVAGQLLQGVEKGDIKLLKFYNTGEPAQEIGINQIKIYNNDSEIIEWEEHEIYYEGDLVNYNGSEFESLSDNNEGNIPDQSDEWEKSIQVWSEIDNVNAFYIEKDASSAPKYLHLYLWYQNADGPEKYLASFEAEEAINYLNKSGLVWYQLSAGGRLTGSIFLEFSNDLFVKSAEMAGIEASGLDISFDDMVNRWWSTTRNFALGSDDNFRFLYLDDSVMWSLPQKQVQSLEEAEGSPILLLGDALSSGLVLGSKQAGETKELEGVKLRTGIIERFYALDSLYLVEGNRKTLMPVSVSGFTVEDFAGFIEDLIEGAKNETWKPYQSEELLRQIPTRDLELRMMVYEEEAADLAFAHDKWNKSVTYYFEDRVKYAGILYESLKENNVDHIPEQWPEYWKVVSVNMDTYYPDELRNIKVFSDLVFDLSGNIISVTPRAFCLQVPGNFVVTGFNKDIAWFDLADFQQEVNPSFNRIINLIRNHEFHAELIRYQPVEVAH